MKRIYYFYSLLFSSFIITGGFILKNYLSVNNTTNKIQINISGAFKYPGKRIASKETTIFDILKSNEYFENADLSFLNLEQKIFENMTIYLPYKTKFQNGKLKLSDLTSELQISSRGINSKIAKIIFDNRKIYRNWEEILSVKGIGLTTLEKLKAFLII